MTYRFGPFVADRSAYRAWKGHTPLDLTPKLLDLLFYLLARPAVLVTKEELLEGVWPGANVTDNALAQAISDLREALGDEPQAPTYIRTVARRGYRFVAPVESDGHTPHGSSRPTPAAATDAAPGTAGKTIAVLDFENVTGGADVAWLATGIAETVTSDLAGLNHFVVVDRWRVIRATQQTGGTVQDIARAVGAHLLVLGGYQRHGPRLRITARMVDVDSGDTLADAKVDGAVDEVFELQDGIVTAFARTLDLPQVAATNRIGVRETSSLDAYRAFTEGLVKIESMDTDLVRGSIADFEHAIAFDPTYAMAYTGLANAQFVAYEMTRTTELPDTDALASGIEHARRALQLDERLPEAHATLSFLLMSAGAFDDARSSAQRAVALEPDNWRHQYRLGHALWGGQRLRALDRALALHPQFAYACFEGAMVHVARGQLHEAERLTRRSVEDQHRQPASSVRFPGVGFHWLLGALEAARGRDDEALAEFELEVSQLDRRRLYGPEFAGQALVGRGHAYLATDRPHEALEAFRQATAYVPGLPHAIIGAAATLDVLGRHDESMAVWQRLRAIEQRLRARGRRNDALLLAASAAAARGEVEDAVARFDELMTGLPPCPVAWYLPIEPLLAPHRSHAGILAILARLAERAR